MQIYLQFFPCELDALTHTECSSDGVAGELRSSGARGAS